jgi:hypothetical protein
MQHRVLAAFAMVWFLAASSAPAQEVGLRGVTSVVIVPPSLSELSRKCGLREDPFRSAIHLPLMRDTKVQFKKAAEPGLPVVLLRIHSLRLTGTKYPSCAHSIELAVEWTGAVMSADKNAGFVEGVHTLRLWSSGEVMAYEDEGSAAIIASGAEVLAGSRRRS